VGLDLFLIALDSSDACLMAEASAEGTSLLPDEMRFEVGQGYYLLEVNNELISSVNLYIFSCLFSLAF